MKYFPYELLGKHLSPVKSLPIKEIEFKKRGIKLDLTDTNCGFYGDVSFALVGYRDILTFKERITDTVIRMETNERSEMCLRECIDYERLMNVLEKQNISFKRIGSFAHADGVEKEYLLITKEQVHVTVDPIKNSVPYLVKSQSSLQGSVHSMAAFDANGDTFTEYLFGRHNKPVTSKVMVDVNRRALEQVYFAYAETKKIIMTVIEAGHKLTIALLNGYGMVLQTEEHEVVAVVPLELAKNTDVFTYRINILGDGLYDVVDSQEAHKMAINSKDELFISAHGKNKYVNIDTLDRAIRRGRSDARHKNFQTANAIRFFKEVHGAVVNYNWYGQDEEE